MKKVLFFLILSLLSIKNNAQVMDTTWLNQTWEETVKDSADYYRTLKIDSVRAHFILNAYHKNGVLLTSSTYRSLSPKIKDGVFIWNYPNKKMERWYVDNKTYRTIERNAEGDIILDKCVDTVEYIDGEPIYDKVYVEYLPKFQGGTPALLQYLMENTNYPREALQQKIGGTVEVEFVINTKGEIVKPYVSKSVHKLLDDEAIRVVQKMPKWIPGKQNGKPINKKMRCPVNFGARFSVR